MDEETISVLYEVFISNNPQGTWDEFCKRLDWIEDAQSMAIQKAKEQHLFIKFLSSKNLFKKVKE